MRDLIVAGIVLAAMPISFRRPFVGMLMFSVLAYMRLQDLAWGFAKAERWSLYIAVLMGAGYMAQRDKRKPVMEVRTVLLIFLVVFIGMGQFFARGSKPVDLAAYVEYVKIIGIAIFTTCIVYTKQHVRILVWTIGMSFGFYGLKNGLAGIAKLGNMYIIRGPGGMLEDNNDFALAVAMSIPLLVHLGTSETNETLRKGVWGIVPLSMATVILTRSRGGALSMSLALAILILRSKNKAYGIAMGAIALVGVIAFAPAEWSERIKTIQTYESDGSAQGRLKAWAVAMRMVKDNPITGVGFDRFVTNHLDYEPNPTLEQVGGGGGALVAHNSYFQLWAECGTPALATYLILLFLTFRDLWKVRKEAKRRYNRSWILSYCAMFEASLATFMLGSSFLNRAHFDLIYHYFTIVLIFGRVARQQMQEDDDGLGFRHLRGRRGTLQSREVHGFQRRVIRQSGFRNTPLVGKG